MIRKVVVTNNLGDSLTLDLFNPVESGLAIRSISGLGPTKGNINSLTVSTGDGAIFSSARLDVRDIVMKLVYLPSLNETIEDIRHKTYKYFPVKKPVTLTFYTDTRVARITGYVSNNKIEIFSEQEGSQITIECLDPFFYSVSDDPTDSEITFSKYDALLEFEEVTSGPFAGKYCVKFTGSKYGSASDYDTVILSEINMKKDMEVLYEGDDDTGVSIVIHANGAVTNPVIYNETTSEQIKLNTEMEAGEEIYISTIVGKKSVTVYSDGYGTNLLNSLDKTSKWISIVSGYNTFSYSADEGADNMIVSIQYDTKYEGI